MFMYHNDSKQCNYDYSDMNKTQQYRGTLFDRTIDEHDNIDNSKYNKHEETLSIINEEPQYLYNVPNKRKCSLQSFNLLM